jgi:hypothetical protein
MRGCTSLDGNIHLPVPENLSTNISLVLIGTHCDYFEVILPTKTVEHHQGSCLERVDWHTWPCLG